VTWVDWVIVAFLALGAWEGLRRGLFAGALAIASYAVAWLAAARLSVPLGTFLDHRFGIVARLQSSVAAAAPGVGSLVVRPVAPVLTRVVDDIAYVLVLLAVLAAASVAVRVVSRLPLGLLAGPNRLGGLLLGAARNAVIVLIVWAVLAPYAVTAGPPISSAVDRSRLLAVAASLTARLPAVGALLPVGSAVR
jgi:uncharacterized membrane protein required for colicin V production